MQATERPFSIGAAGLSTKLHLYTDSKKLEGIGQCNRVIMHKKTSR